jgi:heptosyltransferase III
VKPRILVIRGGAIGDFILTLPAIKLLRENFPDAHLEILGYRHIVAVAEGRFYAEGARSIEYGPMAGFFVPHSVLDPALTEYFASFQQVISYLFDPDGFFEGNLRRAGVKNFLSAYQKIDDSEHASLQLARPLQSLALFLENHAATVYPSPEDREHAAPLFSEAGGPIIAVHPGSGSPRKNWPVEHWIALGRWIFAHYPAARLSLVGGEADGPQVSALSAAFPGKLAFIARDLELPKLAAFLERCAVFLGHDSGISHLAAAVGTRCILLFGPTDPTIWAPANPDVKVIQAPDADLNNLPVAFVSEALKPLLDGENGG